MDQGNNPDPCISLCMKILEKIEKIKMKTNVLGLNISLNEDFNSLYDSMRKSFTSELERIKIVIKSLLQQAEASLKLIYIQGMRSYNSIVYQIRRKYKLDQFEAKIKVVPYNKYEKYRQLVEEKIVKLKKINFAQKKEIQKKQKDELELILGNITNQQKETYQGFQTAPNDSYIMQNQPKLASIYWQVIDKFKVQMSKVFDILYHQNTNLVSKFASSILKFNEGLTKTRKNILLQLFNTTNDQLGKEKYKNIGNSVYNHSQFVPKSGILKNKFKSKTKKVSIQNQLIVEKKLCRNVKEATLNHAIQTHSPEFQSHASHIWQEFAKNNFWNIDEYILSKEKDNEILFQKELQNAKKSCYNFEQLSLKMIHLPKFFPNSPKKNTQQQIQQSVSLSQQNSDDNDNCEEQHEYFTAIVQFDQNTGYPVYRQIEFSTDDKIDIYQSKSKKIKKKKMDVEKIWNNKVQEQPQNQNQEQKEQESRNLIHHVSKNKRLMKQSETPHLNKPPMRFGYENNPSNRQNNVSMDDKDIPKEIYEQYKHIQMSFFTEIMLKNKIRLGQPLSVWQQTEVVEPIRQSLSNKMTLPPSQPISQPSKDVAKYLIISKSQSKKFLSSKQFYDLFCQKFQIQKNEAKTTQSQIHRYNMVLSKVLQNNGLLDNIRFAILMLKQTKFMEDILYFSEQEYIYKGAEVFFYYDNQSQETYHKVLQQFQKTQLKSIVLYGDSISIVTKERQISPSYNLREFCLVYEKDKGKESFTLHQSYFRKQFSQFTKSFDKTDVIIQQGIDKQSLDRLKLGIIAMAFKSIDHTIWKSTLTQDQVVHFYDQAIKKPFDMLLSQIEQNEGVAPPMICE